MPRKSTIQVIQHNTLWATARAIHDAGGTAGSDIDAAVVNFIETGSALIAAQISTLNLGVFAANTEVIFDDFYRGFGDQLVTVLKSFGWLGDDEDIASLANWQIGTTLGQMSADLVDEFDSKVDWQPFQINN